MALGEYRGPLSYHAFVRYAFSRYNKQQVELIRDMYIAEALRQQGRGFYLTRSLSDVLGIGHDSKEDRTAEEIIDDVISRMEAS